MTEEIDNITVELDPQSGEGEVWFDGELIATSESVEVTIESTLE